MPFRDIADPEQLAMLTGVVNDICDEAGIDPASPEHEEVAFMVMRFYWAGYRTAPQLKAALDKAMGWELYG